jgi:phosphotransferase system  glucose/maltose/N-acetylglucosamine-specific IIC component
MDSFQDSDSSSSFFSSLTPSVLFEKLNIMYLLIGVALLVIGYFVYKFYLNRKNLIGSTNINNLNTGEFQESSQESSEEN